MGRRLSGETVYLRRTIFYQRRTASPYLSKLRPLYGVRYASSDEELPRRPERRAEHLYEVSGRKHPKTTNFRNTELYRNLFILGLN